MRVKVHYISLVKSYTNKSEDEFTLNENATIAQLLDQIARTYGKQFTAEVYDPTKEEMKSTFVVMINGVLMDQLKGVHTQLNNGDSVVLMSLMTGG
jgi:MoaD family protein